MEADPTKLKEDPPKLKKEPPKRKDPPKQKLDPPTSKKDTVKIEAPVKSEVIEISDEEADKSPVKKKRK